MIEVNATLFTLMAEACAFFMVMSMSLLVAGSLRRRRDRRALKRLVATINGEAEQRLARSKSVHGDSDTEHAVTLNRQERVICEAWIRAYSKRESASIDEVYEGLKQLVDAYQSRLQTTLSNAEKAVAESGSSEEKDRRIADLEREHGNISKELEITRVTMEKMLREYNSMFEGGVSDGEGSAEIDEIISSIQHIEAAAQSDADGIEIDVDIDVDPLAEDEAATG